MDFGFLKKKRQAVSNSYHENASVFEFKRNQYIDSTCLTKKYKETLFEYINLRILFDFNSIIGCLNLISLTTLSEPQKLVLRIVNDKQTVHQRRKLFFAALMKTLLRVEVRKDYDRQ